MAQAKASQNRPRSVAVVVVEEAQAILLAVCGEVAVFLVAVVVVAKVLRLRQVVEKIRHQHLAPFRAQVIAKQRRPARVATEVASLIRIQLNLVPVHLFLLDLPVVAARAVAVRAVAARAEAEAGAPAGVDREAQGLRMSRQTLYVLFRLKFNPEGSNLSVLSPSRA